MSVLVERFKSEHKLKSLGIPEFIGAGSHEYSGEKYRFVVMHKFSTDLWKVFLEHGRSLPEATVFQITIQIVRALHICVPQKYSVPCLKLQLLQERQKNETTFQFTNQNKRT